MNTQAKLDELLVKFQEIYNDFTDLQEENSNLKKQLEEWKTTVKDTKKVSYDDMLNIVEEVIDSINGESITLSDYELSIGYDNRVELEYCYLDTGVNDFNVRGIVENSLSEYLQKNEYNIGYTIKGSDDNTSKEGTEFTVIKTYTKEKAVNILKEALVKECRDINDGESKTTEYIQVDKFQDGYKYEVVKVELVEIKTQELYK